MLKEGDSLCRKVVAKAQCTKVNAKVRCDFSLVGFIKPNQGAAVANPEAVMSVVSIHASLALLKVGGQHPGDGGTSHPQCTQGSS